MAISDKYPTEPLKEQYNATPLSMMTLYNIKQYADNLGIQINVNFKPEGLKIECIRKNGTTKAVRKQVVYVENKDMMNLGILLQQAINSVMVC